ncbi:DUF2057 family protein [Vibrio owensii]|uniref:DUF2057 family protein n=1 Tax=Vibrio owensii TaxID=696485 RepID=UPI0038CDB7A9
MTLKASQSILVEDVLDSDGVQIGRNYAQEARNYNIAGGVAGVAVTVVTVNQHSQAVTGVEPKVVATADAQSSTAQDSQMVDLLKTMYQKATPQEKETFKKWVAQQ